MFLKSQLQQKDDYAIAYAVYRAAKMLVNFHRGVDYELCIGSEQGISKWDDFVIEHNQELLEHLQVKRQTTDFSDDPPIRDKIDLGKPTERERKLTSFDESIRALADWTRTNNILNKKIFTIVLPTKSIQIKKLLFVKTLSDCCELEIKDTTTIEGFDSLKSTGTYKNLFHWLFTYCGFDNSEHALKALRLLRIYEMSYEPELKENTNNILSPFFLKTDEVIRKLNHFLKDNFGYTSAITTRNLYNHLSAFILPGNSSWTQYKTEGANWMVCGTQDVSTEIIERPRYIVKGLWDSNEKRLLKISTLIHGEHKLEVAITRMAIHSQALCSSHIVDKNRWHQATKMKIGGTFGLSEFDFELNHFAIEECLENGQSSESRVISGLNEQEQEADSLTSEMNNVTIGKVLEKIDCKLGDLPNSTLRTAIEKRWSFWKQELQANPIDALTMCCSILYPRSEGLRASTALRVGLKTIELIYDAIFLLLVSAVALSEDDFGWKSIDGIKETKTIGLEWWSGPTSDLNRSPRRLSDIGINEMLSKESGRIIILSRVEVPEIYLLQQSLAHSATDINSIASPHKPEILITLTPTLRQLIKDGNLEKVREYFKQLKLI